MSRTSNRTEINVDIGGTFTDCLATDGDGTVHTAKALTTHHDLSVGFLRAVGEIAEPGADAAQQLFPRPRVSVERAHQQATRVIRHGRWTIAENRPGPVQRPAPVGHPA